jgi:hypothetical protein
MAVISAARILVVVLQLGYVKLYTTSLSNYSLGIYALWCTISYILNAAVFVPIDYYQQANIYPLRAQGKSLMGLVYFNFNVFKWIGLTSIVVVLTATLFKQTLGLYVAAAAGLAVTTYAANALRGVLNNLEHKQVVALVQALEAFGKIIVLLVLISLTGATALQVIGSQVVTFMGSVYGMVVLAHGDLQCWEKRNSECARNNQVLLSNLHWYTGKFGATSRLSFALGASWIYGYDWGLFRYNAGWCSGHELFCCNLWPNFCADRLQNKRYLYPGIFTKCFTAH